QTPVDDQGLAVLAEDDVARLEVAVEDAPAVRVVDGVADVGEPPQQGAEGEGAYPGVAPEPVPFVEGSDGVLEGVAADEPHGVEGPAVGVGSQPVDRDNPRVFQPPRDLSFGQ